jgi:hypothetical protein
MANHARNACSAATPRARESADTASVCAAASAARAPGPTRATASSSADRTRRCTAASTACSSCSSRCSDSLAIHRLITRRARRTCSRQQRRCASPHTWCGDESAVPPCTTSGHKRRGDADTLHRNTPSSPRRRRPPTNITEAGSRSSSCTAARNPAPSARTHATSGRVILSFGRRPTSPASLPEVSTRSWFHAVNAPRTAVASSAALDPGFTSSPMPVFASAFRTSSFRTSASRPVRDVARPTRRVDNPALRRRRAARRRTSSTPWGGANV